MRCAAFLLVFLVERAQRRSLLKAVFVCSLVREVTPLPKRGGGMHGALLRGAPPVQRDVWCALAMPFLCSAPPCPAQCIAVQAIAACTHQLGAAACCAHSSPQRQLVRGQQAPSSKRQLRRHPLCCARRVSVAFCLAQLLGVGLRDLNHLRLHLGAAGLRVCQRVCWSVFGAKQCAERYAD